MITMKHGRNWVAFSTQINKNTSILNTKKLKSKHFKHIDGNYYYFYHQNKKDMGKQKQKREFIYYCGNNRNNERYNLEIDFSSKDII